MHGVFRTALLASVAAGWALHGAAATLPTPVPDDGAVGNGVFTSVYFNLSYPLPPGWIEGTKGPAPSASGYYVLGTFVPAGELSATLLIAAQDIFFAARPVDDAMAMAGELARSIARVDGMSIDRPPAQEHVGGRGFGRVDFNGVGLFRSTWITKIRCHLVSFNLTAKSPERLDDLIRTLKNVAPADGTDGGEARQDPVCMAGYASTENLRRRVDPPPGGPAFMPIPVRIVVDADGSVKNVHVIRAPAGQRDNIEKALGQWKLKPHEVDGRPEDVETGLLINFSPAGAVQYKASAVFQAR